MMRLAVVSIFFLGASSIRLPAELVDKTGHQKANTTWMFGAHAQDLSTLSEGAQQAQCLKMGCKSIPNAWLNTCCHWCSGTQWWNCGSLYGGEEGGGGGTRGTMYQYDKADVAVPATGSPGCATPAIQHTFYAGNYDLLGNEIAGPSTCYHYRVKVVNAGAAGRINTANIHALNENFKTLSARVWCTSGTASTTFIAVFEGQDCGGGNNLSPVNGGYDYWYDQRLTDFSMQENGHSMNSCQKDTIMATYADGCLMVGSNFAWPDCKNECLRSTTMCQNAVAATSATNAQATR